MINMAATSPSVMTQEQELADHLKGLVKPIRKQHESKEEQAECLYELGKLYLQKAIECKSCDNFTKASGLFNAALIRTSSDGLQTEIKENMSELKTYFLKCIFGIKHATPIMLTQWEQRIFGNKQILAKMRNSIEAACTNLRNIIGTYDDESEKRQEMEKILVKEAKRVSLQVQEEMLYFIRMLWQQSLDDIDLTPPCNYSIIGLGSLARQEVTPYSDLEFAILVEEQNDEVQEYFKKSTCAFHLNVLDLGETPIPTLAILSLNDFMTPGGDWFYDKVTPSGFKLDGAMPWACKTPIGRQATFAKEPLSLIKTPTGMAELLRTNNELGQSYHVADVLSHAIFIHGDQQLYKMYMQKYFQVVDSDSEKFKEKGLSNLKNDLNQFKLKLNHVGYLNAKLYIYRFASTSLENMRLYLTPSFLGGSHWNTIEHLVDEKKLSAEQGFNISVGIAISFALRLLTYFKYRGQHETIVTFQSDLSCTENTTNLLYYKDHQVNRNMDCLLHTFFSAVFDMFITFNTSKLASEIFASPQFQKFSGKTFNKANMVMPIFHVFVMDNFYWAEENEEIPAPSCGLYCQRHIAETLEAIEEPLPAIDSLLQKTNDCVCLSTLEIHLKIYKYFLTKSFSDTDIEDILAEVTKSKSMREKCFLILGLLQMIDFSTDKEYILRSGIGYAEDFLRNVKDLPDKARSIFHNIRFRFHWALMCVYDLIDESEKIIQLCETIVEELEKPLQHESVSPYIAMVYWRQGRTLFKFNERQDEAIVIYKKALDILEKFRYYIRPATFLSNTILELANMLTSKQLYSEATELVKKYFFNETNSLSFTSVDILKASGELARCYGRSKTISKALEVLEQASQLVNTEEIGGQLSDMERYFMARELFDCYTLHGRFKDISHAVNFHHKMCMDQKDQELGCSEHKLYLMNISVELLFWDLCTGFDLSQGLGGETFRRAHGHSQTQRDAETTVLISKEKVTWLDALIALCDMFLPYAHPRGICLIYNISLRVDDILEPAIKAQQLGILPNLLTVYLDYRRCPFILDWSLRNTRFLIYAIYFLQQTLVLIQLYFSHTTLPERWISQAVNKCTIYIKSVLSEQRRAPPNLISNLISRRKNFLEAAAKTRFLPYIGCKLKNIIRYI